MHIDIDLSAFPDLSKAWQQAPKMLLEELTRATTESSLLLEREIKENTPIGVGGGASGLKGSIAATEPRVLADNVIGLVGTPKEYAIPVELGTKPHFPPVDALTHWVRHKLDIRDSDEVDAVALAVARKIAARGTKGAFMFRKGLKSTQAQIQRIYHAAQKRIVQRLADV